MEGGVEGKRMPEDDLAGEKQEQSRTLSEAKAAASRLTTCTGFTFVTDDPSRSEGGTTDRTRGKVVFLTGTLTERASREPLDTTLYFTKAKPVGLLNEFRPISSIPILKTMFFF